ncbi:uncharacterized protein [Rutidosis leptorrhynchoides]|uniref:uncharacterized protein n=1 Tax=Rutidosis leptorrhynchoides TaxID=125765 RepID=UPI003A99BFDE
MAGEFAELISLMNSVVMVPDKIDSWRWTLSGNGIFITKILSDVITTKLLGAGTNCFETMRNDLVPKKVEVFVWRAKRRRLPVLSELNKRGIDLHSVRCPLCDDDIETVDHFLFLCQDVLDIWAKVRNWWGLNGSSAFGIGDAFNGHSALQMTSLGAKIWQGVEWTCGYLIWKNRNQKVFKNKCWNPPVVLNEIQVKSFEWIAKRCRTKKIDWFT